MRVWPHKHSRDNWETLKHVKYLKKEWIHKKKNKPHSKRGDSYKESIYYTCWETNDRIQNKLHEEFIKWAFDYKIWVKDLTTSYPKKVDSIINYEEKLDFFDMDKVDAIDYSAMRLLIDNKALSIENDWYDINKDTIIYIRDRWANIRGKIILKDLLRYVWFHSNNYRKQLNDFMDYNNILEINISTKNPEYSGVDILPKYLKWSGKSKMLNGWIIADNSQIKWKPNNYDYLPWKNKKNHKKVA